MVWIQRQERIHCKAKGSTVTDKLMASAGKLSDIAKGSCERLRNLYGKRVDDLVQEKAKDKLNQIRAKADGDRDTTD